MQTSNGPDVFLERQRSIHELEELKDIAVAVDATYYLQSILNVKPNEPLLSALGGVTGIVSRIEADLDSWDENNTTPFFIFDGVPITGEDAVASQRAREANIKTDLAWELYFNGRANEAVAAFGENTSAFRPHGFYRLLQGLLKKRGHHFLVAPFKAAAQIAALEMVNTDQFGAIMGSYELMLYPIHDCIIRRINWAEKSVTTISKQHVLKALNVSESLFIDAFLMTGTSFLPPFPPLADHNIIKLQPPTVADAVNLLRTAEKSVSVLCNMYLEVLKAQDPTWLDKYRKARMAVDHFISIAESGEVKVHNADTLTKDNHEYLGLQLPSELFHYLNTGLIQPRLLSWVTHGQLYILPTLDGTYPDEYRKLVTTQSLRIKEAAVGLLNHRLNRGISYKNIYMRVWFDDSFHKTVYDRHQTPSITAFNKVISWNIKEEKVKAQFPDFAHGSILSEVLALQKPEFLDSTFTHNEKIKNLSTNALKSISIWRFLHLREYVDDKHQLTKWGSVLATALVALKPTVERHPDVPSLYESIVAAFELIRFDLLNARNKHDELRGLPMNGSVEDQESLLLISRCATLLKLRHQQFGYTGPLSKSLLAFRSLASEVRSADRDLLEAILASAFMTAQTQRRRDDSFELSTSLPFLYDPDVAFGIAVKTYFDDIQANDPELQKKKEKFPTVYIPFAEAFAEDLDIACDFFRALQKAVKTLPTEYMSDADKKVWENGVEYIALRS